MQGTGIQKVRVPAVKELNSGRNETELNTHTQLQNTMLRTSTEAQTTARALGTWRQTAITEREAHTELPPRRECLRGIFKVKQMFTGKRRYSRPK